MQKIPIVLSKISFVGKHLFNRFFGVTTAGNAQREIGTVMVRGRGYFGGEDKPITGINRSMLFETIMRNVFPDRPVHDDHLLYPITRR